MPCMADERPKKVDQSNPVKYTQEQDFRGAVLLLPTYDNITNAPDKEGSFAYATGDGATSEGVYWYKDGVGWQDVSGGGSGVTALSGLSIDADKDWGGFSITNFGTLNGVTPENHSVRHENGGADEISVAGLSGDLADAQDPKGHAASHKDGGSDELDAAELAAALGTSGQVLTSDGSAASWSDLDTVDIENDGVGVVTNASIINFGTNVSVTDNGSGKVTITANDQDTRVDVSDSGSQVVSGVSDINFTDSVTVTDDGDGSVSVSVTKYTDEEARDAVGAILSNDFSYNDDGGGVGSITMTPHASTSDAHHSKTTDMDDLTDVMGVTAFTEDTAANRPAPGTEGRIFFESDTGRVLYDSGSSWVELGLSESQISLANLATKAHSDLSGIGSSDHHAKYTDEEAQDAVGNNVGDGLSYDDANATVEMNVVATGSVTLSSGSATIDTGVSEATTATFQVAIGPTTDDSEITASIQANSGGNYTVHFDEINTSVGNPTVEYDVIRVR